MICVRRWGSQWVFESYGCVKLSVVNNVLNKMPIEDKTEFGYTITPERPAPVAPTVVARPETPAAPITDEQLYASWFRRKDGTLVSAESRDTAKELFGIDVKNLKGRERLVYQIYASGIGGFLDSLKDLGQGAGDLIRQAMENLAQQRAQSAEFKKLRDELEGSH